MIEDKNIEILKMAVGFNKAFLDDGLGDDFCDLYAGICDSYSLVVDAQITICLLEEVIKILTRNR